VAGGFILVHVAPRWSAFSDPFQGFGADALSWVLVAVPVLAGFNLAAHATRAMRPSALDARRDARLS
jgi:hypothetical protein